MPYAVILLLKVFGVFAGIVFLEEIIFLLLRKELILFLENGKDTVHLYVYKVPKKGDVLRIPRVYKDDVISVSLLFPIMLGKIERELGRMPISYKGKKIELASSPRQNVVNGQNKPIKRKFTAKFQVIKNP